jgi:hypothetical protein
LLILTLVVPTTPVLPTGQIGLFVDVVKALSLLIVDCLWDSSLSSPTGFLLILTLVVPPVLPVVSAIKQVVPLARSATLLTW